MKRIVYFWIVAILITLATSIYQRSTGPTYPKKLIYSHENTEFTVKLPRSGGIVDKEIDLNVSNAVLHYRLYPSNGPFINEPFKDGKAFLPKQGPAGKLEYYISIYDKDYFSDEPLIIRFKGDISAWVLIPHILFLFSAMLFGAMTFLLAIFNDSRYIKYTRITVMALFIGGFVFGPLVQYQAFGEYWTGFPYGMDLTDNKTLIAFIALFIALVMQFIYVLKKYHRIITIIAIIVLFTIFSIPHSLNGSQLNPETGKIETGQIEAGK